MIVINRCKNILGEEQTLQIQSSDDLSIDAEGLTVMPALIDPHVHFRTPGSEYKENWKSGANAALAGGVTTVFDMPNNTPSCCTLERLLEKRHLIEEQLSEVDIPLRYHLYFGANKKTLDQIPLASKYTSAIKVFMGSSTGNLLIDDDKTLEKIFKLAKKYHLTVAIHAEDECILRERSKLFSHCKDPSVHSKIRDRSAAIKAVDKALFFSKKYGTRLYILHISTKEEVELIRKAKSENLTIFSETTPHYLFYTENSYQNLGTKIQMNPPLRSNSDQDSLWEGIYNGTIDAIGTDHAPHTFEEKTQPYGCAPSGVPGIETLLPLLLNAHHSGKISLEKILALTRTNVEHFFSLKKNNDLVLVDLNKQKKVEEENLKTKCAWSPFASLSLTGWPIFTILKEKIYKVDTKGRSILPLYSQQAIEAIK